MRWGGGETDLFQGRTYPEKRILRSFFEPVPGNARRSEDAALDIPRDLLGITAWPSDFVSTIDIIRPSTVKSHVRPPLIVPFAELST